MRLLLLLALVFGTSLGLEQVPIGLSVWDSYSDVFTAMQYALEKYTNDSSKMFQFKVYADRIRTIDAYKVNSKLLFGHKMTFWLKITVQVKFDGTKDFAIGNVDLG